MDFVSLQYLFEKKMINEIEKEKKTRDESPALDVFTTE